jgi:hypothetical protein
VRIHQIEIARTQVETAIDLFLSGKDFLAALTLAGAAEDILGKLVQREGKKNMLENLHGWYQETTGEKIGFGEFAKKANFTRNTLKHANAENEDEIEVFRWEAVQMIMRALFNYKQLVGNPTEKMLVFNAWLQKNKGAYEELE